MITIYTYPRSGHAHRAELMLSLLGLAYERRQIDLFKGEQRTPAFTALNPFAQVPVLDDGGTIVADSNAILVYLARRYGGGAWLPHDPAGEAQVQRWLSAAAGMLAFGPAAARANRLFGGKHNPEDAQARAARLYQVMESELSAREWLAGAAPSLADIAMYSYTAVADEGGISLTPYPQVRAWLTRIEALPRFHAMPRETERGQVRQSDI
ncbi:glutathione S-transferase family protein [Massilia sp. TS11]|uniref:glutathione S-transferase family protein n=1 Tax=Massilia sp. TS11 TaxID=2908003 RepID=UPI001EDC0CC2|nr:glutathione S-transferase [Massilia sp. TS11]MCG2585895.1 glutathione S-transferase [Massilia sp. TS11]